MKLLALVSRVEQADLTLVVVDCAQLPSDAQQAFAFLQDHLRTVLPAQEQPEAGETSRTSLIPVAFGLFALKPREMIYFGISCIIKLPGLLSCS